MVLVIFFGQYHVFLIKSIENQHFDSQRFLLADSASQPGWLAGLLALLASWLAILLALLAGWLTCWLAGWLDSLLAS